MIDHRYLPIALVAIAAIILILGTAKLIWDIHWAGNQTDREHDMPHPRDPKNTPPENLRPD